MTRHSFYAKIFRDKQKSLGLTQMNLWVPITELETIKALIRTHIDGLSPTVAWGCEDVEPNLVEAYKLFRQAGDLGFSDALIRVGELQEHGKGCGPSRSLLGRDFHSHFAPRSHFAFAPGQIDLQWWRQQPDLSPPDVSFGQAEFLVEVPLT